MSAPLDEQAAMLDDLFAPTVEEGPSPPSVLDTLRNSAGTDPTLYNHAVAEVPLGASPLFAAESPEWAEDRELKRQAQLIEERPRLRSSLEKHPDLMLSIGAERLEPVARAYDSIQQNPQFRSNSGPFSDVATATQDQIVATGLQYEATFHGIPDLLGVLTGTGADLEGRQKMLEAMRKASERQESLEHTSWVGKSFAVGMGQAPHMVVGMGARAGGAAAGGLLFGPPGAVAGGVAAPVITMGAVEGIAFYADALETMPDTPVEDIAAMAGFVGLINGSLELLPIETGLSTLTNKLRRDSLKLLADQGFREYGMYALRRILAQSLAEGGTEALQSVPGTLVPLLNQYFDGEITLDGVADGLFTSELGAEMAQSALMGAMGAPWIAGGTLAVGAINRNRKVEEAQATRETFQKIADAAVDNRELIDEMPERYHQLMEEAFDEDGQIEGIYINPAALEAAYEGEGAAEFAQLLERVPDLAQRIEAAQDTGGKVRLSPAEFATFVAPSERFQKLGDDLSFREDQESLRESVEATKPENIEKMRAALALLRDAAGADPERDVELEKDFSQTLSTMFEETMPAVAAPVRQKNAQLLGRIVMRIAEMDGSDPLEAMTTLLDRVQFEQRPELDSPTEVQRSGQALREDGGSEVLGQGASISMPVFPERPPSGSVLRDGEEALDLWMMGMGLSDGSDVDPRLLDAWTQLNLVEPDGQGGYTVTEGAWDQELSNWADAAVRYPSAEEFEAFGAATSQPDVLQQQVGVAAPEEQAAPANSNEHLLMVQREEREVGDTGSVKWFRGERGLIKANAKKIAKKIRGDGKRPSKKQVDAVVQQIETYVAFEKARHPQVAGWTSWEYAKSEPKKDDDGNVKLDKDGNVVFQHQPKSQPYQFDKDKKGKALKGDARTRAVKSLANRVHEEIRKVAARAASGDAAANVHIRQAGWYREMRATLRRDFGGLGDLFADLLGATSPQTPVRANWTNASEALSMASSGEFDSLIDQWESWVEGIENAEQAFLEWIAEQKAAGWTLADLKKTGQYQKLKADMSDIRALPDHLNPRKRNGRKFGANGKQVVKTMVNLWRTVKKPDTSIGRGSTAPKAQNFSGNLIGFREGATIDVWAARFLQRLRWGNKIPSKAEGAVQGNVLPGGETTGQFRFGQDVFEAAAELIRNDSDLAGVESFANMNPDDLQAVVWFVEKEIWTIADATSGEGEGGSFEFESWLAGSTEFERIDELRKIIGAKRSTLAEKEAARQELELFERRLDRFVAGLSLETGAWLQGVNFSPDDGEMAAVSARLLDAIHSTDPDRVFVVGSKTASTVGLYGEPERSFDLEIVAREGYDLGEFRRRVFEEARDAHQDSAFVSRVLRDGEDIDYKRHRPGIEVYFRESKTLSEIDPILAELTKILPAGYTVSVDARRSRSARDGEMPSVVGIRAQYIPEFEVRWGDNEQRASPLAGLTEDELASHVRDQGDRMESQVFRILEGVEGVTFAGTLWHETEVVFEGDYDAAIAKGQSNADSSARTRAQDRSSGGEGFFGESVAAGIESAARRIEAVEAAQGRGEIPFGGNAQQSVEAVAGVDRLEQAEADQPDETQAAVDAFNRGDIDLFRQAAFHGTGSRFDRFSTDFMGTGEGAQAFGWGLYFSSSRKIAEFYRSKLAEPIDESYVLIEATAFGEDYSEFCEQGYDVLSETALEAFFSKDQDRKNRAVVGQVMHVAAYLQAGVRTQNSQWVLPNALRKGKFSAGQLLQAVRSEMEDRARDLAEIGESVEAELLAEAISLIKSGQISRSEVKVDAELPSGRGQVFKVDIPDDSELADWDSPMAEQPEAVRQFFGFDPDRVNANLQEVRDAIELIVDNDQPLYENREEILSELDRYVADPNNPQTRQFLADVLSGYQDLIFNKSASNYLEQLEIEHTTDDFEEAYRAKIQELGSDRAVSEALAAAGIKGHKYKAGQLSGGAGDATNYVIYDDAAIQIAETFYSQSQEATPSTRGQLIVDRRIQKFLLQLSEEKVNDSTLTHEIFHLALELVLDASERPGAGPEITAFREQIFGFLGVDSRDQIGRDQHERWAESGEVYMASGEAPTAELRNLFRFFFQRFKQVYRAIRDQLRNADPNNDFVPIFDRLLASEDEIRREADRDNVVAPMLAPELTELMTDAEEEELRRHLESVNAAERAKLERTIAREDERILKAQMGELKRQVREEVYGRRAHKLALWLRTGRTVTGEPIDDVIGLRAEGEHKMNGELLDEVSGDVSTRKSLRGMWRREGGLSPDAVAVAAGYNSADEMLVELLEMEPSEALISRIIHERAEQQGLVSTPEQLREAASEKVDGQARDRLYAAQRRIARRLRGKMPAVDRAERKRLQGEAAPTVAEAQERVRAAKALLDEAIEQGADPGRIEGIQADIVSAEAGVTAAREARADQAQARREARASRSKMPVRAIRAAAREMVNDIEFGQLKREVQRFKKMRAKASMAQTEAALARDWDALEQAIDQEQLSNALAEEGAKRLEDVRKYKRLVESFDKPGSRKRARLSKHGDYEADNGTVTNVMDVIDGLLSMVSFKNMSLRNIERAANVEAFALMLENDAGIALPMPEWVGSVLDRPNYKKMKVGDLEDLYVAIKALEKFGMDLVREREGAAAAAEQEEVDAMLESLDQQKPVAWAGKGKLGENQRSKSAKFFGSAIGSQMSFESIADILDDLNPEGAFNRFFMHRFKAAAREEERLRKMVSEKVNAAWSKYSEREKREFYSKPIKIMSLGQSLSKNEILAIAANMGNPHNRKALEESARYPLSDSVLDEILSHVTDKDADYLESVIDAIDLLWEPAAAAEREINGVVPPKVEAVPWTLPSGRVMKGGYFPLMFDPELDVRSADHNARAIGQGLMPQGGGSSMTKVGALKARKNSGKLTVRTDFHAILQKHVNSMSKDIAWRGTIVRADRQLRKIAPELKRVLGDPFFQHMRNYLKRQSTPIREGDQGPPEFIIKTARHARKGLGLTVMAWRLTQAAIQWSGFVTAIPRVGVANIAWGWADVTSTVWNWDRITNYRELIPELKNRAETFDRDAQQEMLRLKPIDPKRPFSSLDTVQAFSANVGYTLLGMIDTVTSTAVAAGAMRQAMSGQVEGIAANDLDAAVRYAGKIIDRTQGSGGSVNAPSMLDGGEMMKLLTPMMSFVNAQTQQAIVYGALGQRQIGDKMSPKSVIPGVPRDAARFLSFWLWAYLMESLLSEGTRYFIKGLLGPDEPDEEAFFNTVMTRTVMGPLGGVPLVREVETIGKGFKPDTPLSTLAVTAYNATLKPAMDIAEGDYDGEKHIRALATGLTYATGLPSKQALDAMEVLTQESFGRGR